jgi:ribosomal protein L37AE/L43A
MERAMKTLSERLNYSDNHTCIACGTKHGLQHWEEAGIFICNLCEKDREVENHDENSWVLTEDPAHNY